MPSVSPRLVENWYAILAAWFLAGAYLAARDSIRPPGAPTVLGPWQQVYVDLGWFALTLFLLGVVAVNRMRGLALSRALPHGYDVALGACVLFAMGVVLHPYWQQVFGRGDGLENLLAPTRLLAVGSGLVIVSTPLRSALSGREPAAGAPVLVSAALVLAAIAFATQFAHPLVDPWPASGTGLPDVTPAWVAQDLGVASLVLQGLAEAAMILVLVRSLRLPPLGVTVVAGLSALFIALLKDRLEFLPAALATGLAADLVRTRLPGPGDRPLSTRVLAATVATAFSATTMVTVVVVHGTWWRPTLLVGTILLSGLLGWLLSYVSVPVPMRAPLASLRPSAAMVTVHDVKVALEALNDPKALARSPLIGLPCLTGPVDESPRELRALLVDVIGRIAASGSPRDAESGRILLDYYVRRVGSHEVVMDPMHMSKQTYFRRLDKGKALVAERLDELSEQSLT